MELSPQARAIVAAVISRQATIPRYAASEFSNFFRDIKASKLEIEISRHFVVSMAVFVNALLEAASWAMLIFGCHIGSPRTPDTFVVDLLKALGDGSGKKVPATYISTLKANKDMLLKLEQAIDRGEMESWTMPNAIKYLSYGAFNQEDDLFKLRVLRSMTAPPVNLNTLTKAYEDLRAQTSRKRARGGPLWFDVMKAVHTDVGDIDFGGDEYAKIVSSYKAELLRVFRAPTAQNDVACAGGEEAVQGRSDDTLPRRGLFSQQVSPDGKCANFQAGSSRTADGLMTMANDLHRRIPFNKAANGISDTLMAPKSKITAGIQELAAELGVACDPDIINTTAFKVMFAGHHLSKVSEAMSVYTKRAAE